MFSLQIGDIILKSAQVPAELSHSRSFKFDDAEMIDGTFISRPISVSQSEFSCSATLSQAVTPDIEIDSILEKIVSMCNKLNPVPVILGKKYLGYFTIRNYDETILEFSESGKYSHVIIKFALKRVYKNNVLQWPWKKNESGWD